MSISGRYNTPSIEKKTMQARHHRGTIKSDEKAKAHFNALAILGKVRLQGFFWCPFCSFVVCADFETSYYRGVERDFSLIYCSGCGFGCHRFGLIDKITMHANLLRVTADLFRAQGEEPRMLGRTTTELVESHTCPLCSKANFEVHMLTVPGAITHTMCCVECGLSVQYRTTDPSRSVTLTQLRLNFIETIKDLVGKTKVDLGQMGEKTTL